MSSSGARLASRRDLNFGISVFVKHDQEAVRIEDDFRMFMIKASRRWAKNRGYIETPESLQENPPEPEKAK